MSNNDITTNDNIRFDHIIFHLEQFMKINTSTFNKRTYKSLNRSFEILKLFIDRKVDINYIRTLGNQDVIANEQKLAYKDNVELF